MLLLHLSCFSKFAVDYSQIEGEIPQTKRKTHKARGKPTNQGENLIVQKCKHRAVMFRKIMTRVVAKKN